MIKAEMFKNDVNRPASKHYLLKEQTDSQYRVRGLTGIKKEEIAMWR
jgi:hypothetical protein